MENHGGSPPNLGLKETTPMLGENKAQPGYIQATSQPQELTRPQHFATHLQPQPRFAQ